MHYTVIVTGPDPEKQMTPFCESLDVVFEAESKAYTERRQKDENASTAPVYMERIDELESLKLDWVADRAAGKGEENFTEYLDSYYYSELKFVPKALYLAKSEVDVWESSTGGYGSVPRTASWRWSLRWGNRFAVVGENGEIESVIVYAIAKPKWDWYEIGGRWSNFFKVKPEAITRVRYENAGLIKERTEQEMRLSRLFPDNQNPLAHEKTKEGYSDQLMKGDIDFVGMQEEARHHGMQEWDKFHAIVKGRALRTYDELEADYGGDQEKIRIARDADPVDIDLRKTDFMWCDPDQLKEFRDLSREEYGDARARRVFSPYSLLHNGVWEDRETYERGPGKYGWNGQWVKRDRAEWDNLVRDALYSLPDDALVTLIDYHR